MSRVFAVVVTYFHENETFEPLLRRLLMQVDRVIVVDNTPGDNNPSLESLLAVQCAPERYQLLRLGQNSGIACAINVGIDAALSEGAEFILLSDQDSLPADDMVQMLFRAYTELSALGMPVGAVGPTFTDLHTAQTYPFQAQLPGHFFYGHKAPTTDEPNVEALTLITSGTLIPVDAIRNIGQMREDFFIDQVDIEWCHRARWKGYHLFGTGWATMYQRMGEARLRVWYLRWRYESAYSPLRVYYRLRNFVALWKVDFIDFRWKVRNSWYCLGIVYTHFFFAEQQNMKYLLFAIKGVRDGLINRMGPYSEG